MLAVASENVSSLDTESFPLQIPILYFFEPQYYRQEAEFMVPEM